jgi:hypothetical protein
MVLTSVATLEFTPVTFLPQYGGQSRKESESQGKKMPGPEEIHIEATLGCGNRNRAIIPPLELGFSSKNPPVKLHAGLNDG